MQNASQDQILEAIKPELPLLASCVYNAWMKYQEDYPIGLRVDHTPRSRASLVHDHAIAFARNRFESRVGSHCQEINKLFLVCFSNGVVVRFKKLDDNLRASNIATQQCMDFMSQASLPDVPDAVNLHVGYRLNKLETDIEGIYVTCPSGPNANAWFMPLEYGTSNVVHLTTNDKRSAIDTDKKVKFSPRRKDQGNEAAQ